MGSWVITIRGHGAHHNGRPDDAESLGAVFAANLLRAGHNLDSAELVLDGGEGEGRVTDLLAKADEGAVHYPNGLDDPQPYKEP